MKRFRILYVEDNRIDFEMVKAILEDKDLVEVIYRVDKKEDFLQTLASENIDIILTDYTLPVFHGIEVIQTAREFYPDIPVIMVTGNLSDEIAVDVIKKGAWDYVLKENIYRLIPVLESTVSRLAMKREKDIAIKTLKESENNYRVLSESSPYGILVHLRGRVFYHNRTAAKLITGDEDGSFLGARILDYVRPEDKDRMEERMQRLYKGEKIPQLNEVNFTTPAGKNLILELASSPITFHGYPAAQVLLNDIAERKKSEQELLKAKEKAEESDRLKTAFLENLSHEVRTPLNGILGFTSLLKLTNISEEEKKSYLEVIEDSGKHLLTIIDDLIEVSRIETGQFELRKEVFNLNESLQELFAFFDKNEKYSNQPVVLNLTLAMDNEEALIYSDRIRLRQVLYNLLSNAYKFTDEGKIEFGYELIGNNIRFFVKDTGTGIPEEWHESVFERFRQYKNSKERTAGGNGLGLTICKGIINEMNGRIWLDSKPDRGSDFYFEFFFEKADDPVNDEKIEDVEINYKLTDKTILVAEDEPSNYTLIKNILKNTGVKLFHARTGNEVLKMMRTNKSIDLILMDIKMPELDGIGAVKALRENKIKLPVIAQTAYVLSDDKKKCLQAGCDDYVSKPIQPQELLQKIHNFLK